MLLELIGQSMAIAVVAFVVFDLLMEPHQLLSPLYDIVRQHIDSEWWFNAAIGCAKCKAGQLALAYCLLCQPLPLPTAIVFICLAIFFTFLLGKLNG